MRVPEGVGEVVKVKRKHIRGYGYRGTDDKFVAIKQREDNYSGIYNLIDSKGEVITGVMEEDLEKAE